MNDQSSIREQMYKTADLADKNGLYDAADFLRNYARTNPLKYYKSAALGVVGAQVGHTDGEYTLLHGHTRLYSWIKTIDLHETRGEAETARVAIFAEQSP